MQTVKVKLTDIKPNPNNPRIIKDEKFRHLVQSIKDFPAMLELRPIVVNDENVILGGNMRLRACKEAGLKEVPIIKASELTEQQQKEFIIKDNVSFGEWDWDILANEWEAEELTEWGLDIPDLAFGDIIELPKITTTYNVNIKCDTPAEVEDVKDRLAISSNFISANELFKLLK